MHVKYGPEEVQKVPATDKGDFGIEAFTFTGVAIQCYAPQEPLSTDDRYTKQRDKLSTDLAKLEKNASKLQDLLGDTILRRYLFFVPSFNSNRIVSHASTKSGEVCGKNLPIVSSDFRVKVCTADDFPEQRSALLARPKELVEATQLAPEEVDEWIDTNTGLVEQMQGKLGKVFSIPSQRNSYTKQLVAQNLKSDGARTRLRNRFPDQWESITRCVNGKEQTLALDYSMLASSNTSNEVTSLASDLSKELRDLIPELGTDIARSIAWGAIADWLMRCPLDFFEHEDAG